MGNAPTAHVEICGVQLFVRRKAGIDRFARLCARPDSARAIASDKARKAVETARLIQQLREKRAELGGWFGSILGKEETRNAIAVIERETAVLEAELSEMRGEDR